MESLSTAPDSPCSNHNSAVPESKWKDFIYSRLSRTRRQLEEAGLKNNTVITSYFRVLNRQDILEAENIRLRKRLLATTAMNISEEKRDQHVRFSNFLQSLIESAKNNFGKSDTGKRYSSKLKDICTYFFIVGGFLCYLLMYRNLPIPSVSTIRANLCTKDTIREGYFRFKELSDFLTARNLPRRVSVSEDGTRVKGQIQYDRKTNQIVGFPLPLDQNGLPCVGKYPATSARTISKYFEENTVSNIAYCLIVQPIAPNAPSFCLALFGTDNKFDYADVSHRWEWMVGKGKEHDIEIVNFSGDGDTRILKAMCSRVFKNNKNWFSAPRSVPHLFTQDHIHIATKLRGRFNTPSIILPMGKYVASKAHLVDLLQTAPKDQHCLQPSHLDDKDKMNYRSVRIMTDPKVTCLLRSVNKDAEATVAYLELTRDVVDAFTDETLTTDERILKIWKWTFFLRIWRQYLKDNKSYSVSRNFITLNCYYCIELNAHALIHMVRYFRDREEQHLFLPWLTGSQPCESAFRALRSMTSTQSTVVNFSILDMQHRIRRIDYLNEAKCRLGDDFQFPSSRREASSKRSDSSKNNAVSILPEDLDIEFIISSAKEEAVKLATNLGMLTKKKTAVPFMEIPKNASHKEQEDEDDLEDEHDLEHIEMDPSSCENGDENDEDEDENAVDISDISGACSECDIAEDLLQISRGTLQVKCLSERDVHPTSPFVKVLDGNGAVIIWKSTLCWLLSSSDFKLSSDRLLRVKSPGVQSHRCNLTNENVSLLPSVEDEIFVGNYCAFTEEADNSLVIGRVLGFSYSTGKSWHDQQYSKLSVQVLPPSRGARGIDCLCIWYRLLKNKRLEIIPMDNHGFYSISNYICTVPRPTIVNDHLVLACSTRQILNVTKSNK